MHLLGYRRQFCFFAAVLATTVAAAQTGSKTALPPPIEHFIQKVGEEPTSETFYKQAPESLWDVYPNDDHLKASLLEFVKTGADGPELGFAALALIPFHDPATVRPMLQRAMDTHISPATRWCMLNAAPYVLGMGDVMYMGDGNIDKESKEVAKGLTELADQASQLGTGRAHAIDLRELLDAPDAVQKSEDYGLAIWHQSAYLVGTLDLKDEKVLSKALTSGGRAVFQNVIVALGFVVNRDFLTDLKKKQMDEVTPAMEQEVGRKVDEWWRKYLSMHADGQPDDAVMEGFTAAGYRLEPNLRSETSMRELLRALNDPHPEIRYNVYKIFNQLYGTHFDLDVAFFAGKYALSFMDPSGREKNNEVRLRQYWQNRLDHQQPVSSSGSAALRATSRTAGSSEQSTDEAPSLADLARRAQQQKKSVDTNQSVSPK